MMPVNYNDRRAEGETTLRKCQLVQLYLLHIVDTICKQENIPYFLVGGTLLGAMRHNGFIPWDDDLDIGVPYREYRRFLDAMRRNLPSGTFLQTPKDCPHTARPFAKIRDMHSFYCECRPDVPTSAPSGIYIDVFPYEDIPEIGRPLQLLLVKAIGSTWNRTIWFRNKACAGLLSGVPCLIIAAVLSGMHKCFRGLLWLLKGIRPSRTVYNVCELGLPYAFRREDIYPLTRHVFEDGEFPVPGNADGILQTQYGYWREVPPPEKRPCHARIIDPFHSAQE